MDQLATKLVDQVLSERELYEDNARIRHGIPRRQRRGTATQEDSTQQPTALPVAKSLTKLAAVVGLSAVGGGLAAPFVPSAIEAIWPKSQPVVTQPEKQPEPQPETETQKPSDLIEWIRKNRLNNE